MDQTGSEGRGGVKHANKMVDEAKAFTRAVSENVNSFSESVDLRGRVQRAPIGMVSAALGIGYVLGGGLFSPVTRRLLKLGAGMILVPFVKKQLAVMAGSSASPRPAAEPGEPSAL